MSTSITTTDTTDHRSAEAVIIGLIPPAAVFTPTPLRQPVLREVAKEYRTVREEGVLEEREGSRALKKEKRTNIISTSLCASHRRHFS